jgi:hypothetical protein
VKKISAGGWWVVGVVNGPATDQLKLAFLCCFSTFLSTTLFKFFSALFNCLWAVVMIFMILYILDN